MGLEKLQYLPKITERARILILFPKPIFYNQYPILPSGYKNASSTYLEYLSGTIPLKAKNIIDEINALMKEFLIIVRETGNRQKRKYQVAGELLKSEWPGKTFRTE